MLYKEITVNDGRGKELENLLKNKTPINIKRIERKWYNKVFGFRSGKKWKMAIATIGYLILISAIIGVITDDEEQLVENESTDNEIETVEQDNNDDETVEVSSDTKNEDTEVDEVEDAEEQEEQQNEEDEDTEEVDDRTIDEAILEDNDDVNEVTLNDGVLTLVADGKTTFSENTLFHSVYDLFEVMHDGFQDENVNEVYVELLTTMVDTKGKESVEPVIKYNYSRESFEELNYDNFSNMAFGQQWRILREADYYYIHPGIYKNLKDEYKDNLNVEGFYQ